MKPRVLIIDDEDTMARSLREILEAEGFEASTASTAGTGLALARECHPDFVICDIRLPDRSGIEVLKEVLSKDGQSIVIMMTAYAKVEDAIDALRLGAADYLIKPIHFDDLLHRMRRLQEFRQLRVETISLRRSLKDRADSSSIVGKSPLIVEIRELIHRMAPTDSTVLITGESGTGKDLIAMEIHRRSAKASGPFLAVNCSAIPDSLLESELFGYRKGAFSGAGEDKDGMLALAEGGTLFLDEVGDLPLALQPKLLRAIETKEYMPLGATCSRKADVRLIAASNRDLRQMVDRGEFRLDLYYRLSLLEIAAPALRSIPEDIPLMARYFLNDLNKKLGASVRTIEDGALTEMMQARWPGNVRELQNRIHRAIVLADREVLTREDIWPDASKRGALGNTLKDAVRAFETRLITNALERHHGDKHLAAKELGISVATLYSKLKNGHGSNEKTENSFQS